MILFRFIEDRVSLCLDHITVITSVLLLVLFVKYLTIIARKRA